MQIFTSLTKDNYFKFQEKTLGHKMLLGQCRGFQIVTGIIPSDFAQLLGLFPQNYSMTSIKNNTRGQLIYSQSLYLITVSKVLADFSVCDLRR